MAQLRLGAVGLTPKDEAYIRALLRLYAHTAKLDWVFVDQAPYHAVVINRVTGRAADAAWLAQFSGPVLTLAEPPGAPEADTVAYPVHAEQLRTWLTLRQQSLLAPAHHAAPVPAPVQPPAPPAAPAPAAAAAAREAAAPAAAERRYKLRRWPPAALLQRDELHLKIATLLSRNPLSTARLALLTGQPEQTCRAVLITLHQAGVLVESVAEGSTPGHTEAPAASAAAAPVRTGLLASLRRHLGL